MDVAPNMPIYTTTSSTSTNTNILIAVDDFSKFVLLAELPQLTSAAVA